MPLGSFVRQGLCAGVDELVSADEGLGPGVAEQVRDLGGDQVPVDRDEGDAGVGTGEGDLEPLVAVAGDDGDRVAAVDADLAEAVDQTVDALVEFTPCEFAGVVGEGEVVGARRGEGCGEDGHRSGPGVLERWPTGRVLRCSGR